MPSSSTDDTEIITNIREMLVHLGENPDRPGMEKTPKRYLDALKFATSGYNQSLGELVNDALFPLESTGERNMIMVRDIQIYSMCEHHLLPFHGICHIAYIPTKNVLGLSKVARIAEMFSRRFQIQERLTDQIAGAIAEACEPLGVGVVIHAEHMCMTMRGVQKPGSITTTSSLLGCFRSDPRTRQEFLTLAGSYRK